MKKIFDKVADILLVMASLLFFSVFAVNVMEIISRSFFNHSFLWVSDISAIFTVWMICLSMSVAVYRKEHLVMEFLVDMLSSKVRKALAVVIVLISIAFFLILFYAGLQTASAKHGLVFTTILWSVAWAYYALPVFSILSALFMIPRLIELVTKGAETKSDVIAESIF